MALTNRFMKEIARIKEPEIFIGVARLLKVKVIEEDGSNKDFTDIFADVVKNFDGSSKKRKKELLQILAQANKAANTSEVEDGTGTENT